MRRATAISAESAYTGGHWSAGRCRLGLKNQIIAPMGIAAAALRGYISIKGVRRTESFPVLKKLQLRHCAPIVTVAAGIEHPRRTRPREVILHLANHEGFAAPGLHALERQRSDPVK